MKQRLLFSMIIVTAFISLTVSQSYAKLDVLREIDGLVDASKPNVMLIISTDKFMTRAMGDSTSNGPDVSANVADNAASNSRFYNVKCVLIGSDLDGSCNATETVKTGILDQTKDKINYGLMTYNQKTVFPAGGGPPPPDAFAYYPYYTSDCSAASPTACDGTPDRVESEYKGDNFSSGGTTYYYYNFTSAAFSQYPIDNWDAGNIYVKIDYDGKQADQAGPDGTTNSDEVEVIKKYLALQNNGGIALDNGVNDDRIHEVLKKEDASNDNDAYDYFKNIVINNDSISKNGCFTKNYIIYIADGFGNTADYNIAATNAASLFNLDLAASSKTTPVKTFVIGVINPGDANMSNNVSRLNNIARNGGTDATEPVAFGLNRTSIPADDGDNYAFFVNSKAKLTEALKDIASAIAGGDFVTGSPSATSSSGSFVLNNVGMLASTEYPEWRGHIRSVDLVNDYFWWDAGVSLVIPAADAKLPKAVIDARAGDSHSSWRDTDGDTVVDQPPLMVKVGSDIYRYTDRVLYCKTTNNTANNCISSVLISNDYVGTTATFKIGGIDTNYTYKGAFYLSPWKDRNVYTSDLSGTIYDLYNSLSSDSTLLSLGGSDLGDWFGSLSDTTDKVGYAKAIINFALGGIDADKDGDVDTGVDLNGDGVIDATLVNDIAENTAEVTREWWLGDVTNVVTVGVGKPINPKDGLSGRDTFREAYAGRSTIIYTGSNDQMLHAYDFDSGVEKFAYIPPDLLPNLKTLYDNAMVTSKPEAFMGQAANPTDHLYGVASSPKVNDVQFADGTWHTVLVTGEGPGGNHYFALDVTDPSLTFGTSLYTLLWHTKTTTPNLAGSYGSTLGETWSVPAFGRIKDVTVNKWVVFVASGYDDANAAAGYGGGSGSGKGEIFHVINVEDGVLLTDPSKTTSNFFMDATDPTLNAAQVQYALLPDSVTMIQKSGSKVEDGYQVDLKGRVYHIDTRSTSTASWDKRELIANGPPDDLGPPIAYVRPTIAKPFYYSPAVFDFDNTSNTSKHLMVLGSGAYDDPEMERRGDDDDGDGVAASDEEGDSLRNPNIGADLTSTLYFTIVNPASTPAAMIDAFSIEMSAVNGTEVKEDGTIGTTVPAGTLSKAVLVASPVLFNNEVSPGTFELQVLFLVFDPPAVGNLGCSFGNSFLLVFSLGNADTIVNPSGTGFADTSAIDLTKSGEAKFVVSMGAGKVSGIGVAGGGSNVVVGQSGYGGGGTSGFNIAGGNTWDPIGTTTKLFWKEK